MNKTSHITVKTGSTAELRAMLAENNAVCAEKELELWRLLPIAEFIDRKRGDPMLFEAVTEELDLAASLQKLPHELDELTKKKAVLARALLISPRRPVSFLLGDELGSGEKLVFCGLLQQACLKYGLYATVYYAKESAPARRLKRCA